MKIKYGVIDHFIDVTDICLSSLNNNNIITIPSGDVERTFYFSDPLVGTLKSVFIEKDETLFEYNDQYVINIDLNNNKITHYFKLNNLATDIRLYHLHNKLKLNYGSFQEELPEQKMAVRYLSGNEKVLELGSNIGRNSLIIASILAEKNNPHFVTLECDSNIANQLIENMNLNNLNFHIEKSALSKRKLIQKGWDTIASDELINGYQWVNIISFNELQSKFNIVFDTLVLDCEGALYYILMDMPEILDNIKLIIMENDYYDYSKKQFVDEVLKSRNFYVDYTEPGGWGPCYNQFFEVWRK